MSLADIDRPLNERGQRSARAIGQEMQKQALAPDLVLVSPALRTQQTWAGVSAQFAAKPKAATVPELYDFTGAKPLLAVIRQRGAAAQTLMLVAHNPSTHELALHLVGAGDPVLRAQLAEKFPTGALAVISFAQDTWADIGAGSGTLLRFIRPRDLLNE